MHAGTAHRHTPALRRSSRTAGYFAFPVTFKLLPAQQASAWQGHVAGGSWLPAGAAAGRGRALAAAVLSRNGGG